MGKIDIKKINIPRYKRSVLKVTTENYYNYINESFSALTKEKEIEKLKREVGMPRDKTNILNPTSSETITKISLENRAKMKSKVALIKSRAIKKALDKTLENEYSGNEVKKKKVRNLMVLFLFKNYTYKEAIHYAKTHENYQVFSKTQMRYLRTLYYFYLDNILDEQLLRGG